MKNNNEDISNYEAEVIARRTKKKIELLQIVKKNRLNFYDILRYFIFYSGFFILIFKSEWSNIVTAGITIMFVGLLDIIDSGNRRFNALVELIKHENLFKS